MKQTKRGLLSLIKSLEALTQKVEKMIDKIEDAEKTPAKPKKAAVPKKAAKKTAKGSKAASTRKPAVKKAPKKPSEAKAMTSQILEIIQSAAEGVTTGQIIEQTGLNKKQVWNIVSKAKKEGKIAAAGRGIYVPSQS